MLLRCSISHVPLLNFNANATMKKPKKGTARGLKSNPHNWWHTLNITWANTRGMSYQHFSRVHVCVNKHVFVKALATK